jgi:hypothetical protein
MARASWLGPVNSFKRLRDKLPQAAMVRLLITGLHQSNAESTLRFPSRSRPPIRSSLLQLRNNDS